MASEKFNSYKKKKCKSDEINEFYYHDAVIDSVEVNGSNMIWKTSGVCIKTSNSQNNETYDTIADNLEMRFINFQIIDIIKCGYEQYDNNNILIASYANKKLEGNEFYLVVDGMFDSKSYLRLYGGDYEANNYCFDIEINNELYGIILNYDMFIAEWDYTTNEAWYVY